jgi:hypothetical protein
MSDRSNRGNPPDPDTKLVEFFVRDDDASVGRWKQFTRRTDLEACRGRVVSDGQLRRNFRNERTMRARAAR